MFGHVWHSGNDHDDEGVPTSRSLDVDRTPANRAARNPEQEKNAGKCPRNRRKSLKRINPTLGTVHQVSKPDQPRSARASARGRPPGSRRSPPRRRSTSRRTLARGGIDALSWVDHRRKARARNQKPASTFLRHAGLPPQTAPLVRGGSGRITTVRVGSPPCRLRFCFP